MGEENLLLESTIRTYRARWWILMLASFHFMHQNVGLNTWGPIAQSAKGAYDWEDTTIVFILNMGRLGSILFICIGSYILDKAGLRVAMITYSINMLISNSLRSLSKDKDISFILITMGEFLNGCNGVTTFAAPPILAARWFPPGERITASAIMVLAAYVGDGISSIIGPVIVENPKLANNSIANDSTLTNDTRNDLQVVNAEEILNQMMNFLYIQCGVSAMLLIGTIAYFPDKPPSAPSTSAAMARLNYRESFWKLIRNKRLVFLVLVFGIMVGVSMSWIMVIDIIFDPMGVSQINAGLITCYTILAGSILGFIIARFSDIFMKRLKPILLTLFVFIIAAFLWISLIASEILPYSIWQLYVSAIVGGALLNASFPLWYEIVSEMSFPIPGGIINGLSDVIFLIFANVFFVLMYIPVSDYRWMTWIMFVCSMLGFVTLVFFPVTYIRTDIDLEAKEVNDNQDNELDNIASRTTKTIECTADGQG